MLLGKRPRTPMSRTISMTEFAADLELADDTPMPSDQYITATTAIDPHQQIQHLESNQPWWPGDFPPECRRRNTKWAAMIPPQRPRRNSSDFAAAASPIETAPFLRSCGLCKRSLSLGRDIFIYRGEIAFCSMECRQHLMNQEEKKKKKNNSLSSLTYSAPANSAGSDPTDSGEKVAAA